MICVVIKGPTFEEAHQQLLKAVAYADLVELRLDCFNSLDFAALKILRSHFSIPMIFTLRSQIQGGSYIQSEEKRLADIRRLIELKPEYLDLENHVSPCFIAEISSLCPEIKLILSYHNFAETSEDLERIYQEMQKIPAFFYKIAVTAKNCLDAMRLICWAKKSDDKLIAISMGPHGQVSRILGPMMGCPITYAALEEDQKSAPGQLSAKTLIERYHHRSLNRHTALYGLIGDPVDQSISDETHNSLIIVSDLNLDAGQDNKVMQDFELESLSMGSDHSQMAKAAPIESDYGSKDCVNLLSSTAVSRSWLNAVYVKIQVNPSQLSDFLQFAKQLPFHGLSVTMPLKEHVIPLLDEIDSQALEIGAVNTLLFKVGKIFGFNTDGVGALNAIESECPVKDKRIVIVGAGGATKAIAYEAHRRGGLVTIVNRDERKAFQVAARLQCIGKGLDYMANCAEAGYDILINCTPSPLPIAADYILPHAIVMDIRTKPKETEFLKLAMEKGCPIIYGYRMFIEQALGQFNLWFKNHFDIQESRKILEKKAIECLSRQGKP